MNKKSISLALAVTLATTGIGTTVFADPYSSKQEYEQKLQESKNSYKSAQEKVDEIEAAIQKVNAEMMDIHIDIEDTNKKIQDTQNKIKQSEKKVQDTQNSIVEEEGLFNKRMRTMYMNGMDSYIEILLDSNGFSDFISRLDNVTRIISYDKEVMTSLTDKKVALQQEKTDLEGQKNNLEALQQGNQQKLAKLEEKKVEHDKAITVAKDNIGVFEAAMKENEAQLKQTMDQINSMQSSNNSKPDKPSRPNRGDEDESNDSSTPTVPSNVSGVAIVQYAKEFLGVPYQWGGNGPSTFDCSGFTKYVYKAFGVGISRTANSQMGGGTYVPRNQLQPGDLVFFGSGGYATHVGIYVGNNSYIHAPQDNEVVKISPLTRGDYLTAKRHVD